MVIGGDMEIIILIFLTAGLIVGVSCVAGVITFARAFSVMNVLFSEGVIK